MYELLDLSCLEHPETSSDLHWFDSSGDLFFQEPISTLVRMHLYLDLHGSEEPQKIVHKESEPKYALNAHLGEEPPIGA